MNNSDNNYFNKPFSHIYIEKEAQDHPVTQEILSHFPKSVKISIAHYKDIFNRSHQDFAMQKQSPSLILAIKKEHMVYPGAKVCQSFGNEHFYYCSNIMNCLFDCEYCYLQGMYPSGHIVIFVNVEDIFAEVSTLLQKHSVYLCVSYDTDLMALEWMTGFLHQWADFTTKQNKAALSQNGHGHRLTLEVRTKSQAVASIQNLLGHPDIIYAWTLSPAEIADRFEHGAAPLQKRLLAASKAIQAGSLVRLCFDPMLHIPHFQEKYGELFTKTFSIIDSQKIFDVSIGTFRISKDYLKKMRRARSCAITAYPYSIRNGVAQYDAKTEDDMMNYAIKELTKYLPANKIFCWK